MGLSLEAGILRFRDNVVPVIRGIDADIVYSSTPQCGSEELVPVPGCGTGVFRYTDRPKELDYGSRQRTGLTGLTGRDIRDNLGACLHHHITD